MYLAIKRQKSSSLFSPIIVISITYKYNSSKSRFDPSQAVHKYGKSSVLNSAHLHCVQLLTPPPPRPPTYTPFFLLIYFFICPLYMCFHSFFSLSINEHSVQPFVCSDLFISVTCCESDQSLTCVNYLDYSTLAEWNDLGHYSPTSSS